MVKEEGFKITATDAILFAGGIGTAFFFLFTDIGRDMLDSVGLFSEEPRKTLGDLIGESPYEFYPYIPSSTVPDYVTNPNPYFLQGQPYQYVGGPYGYANPAVAEELARPPPDYTWEENPITEWLGKIFGQY